MSQLLRGMGRALAQTSDALSPWSLIDSLKPSLRAVDAWSGAPDGGVGLLNTPPTATHAEAPVAGAHHQYVDWSISQLRSQKDYFYARGFGRTTLLPKFASEMAALGRIDPPPPPLLLSPPGVGDGACGRPWVRVLNGAFPVTAAMRALLPPESWVARVQLVLPEAFFGDGAADGFDAATAAVAREMAPLRPLCLLLPGTAEEGFQRRRHVVAYPLARLGVASLILEGPYYGVRKPLGQDAARLPTLMDLCVLGRATIEECIALAKWAYSPAAGEAIAAAAAGCVASANERTTARSTGDGDDAPGRAARDALSARIARRAAVGAAWPHPDDALAVRPPPGGREGFGAMVIAGTSMGGLHAAMAAASAPRLPLGVASWVGPPSAANVFTTGALAGSVAWDALARDAREPAVRADIEAMEARLRELVPAAFASHDHAADALRDHAALMPANAPRDAVALVARALRITDITNFPPPRVPSAANFVVASHDQYVPRTRANVAQWRALLQSWPGAHVQQLVAGHVSASLFHSDTYAATVIDSIRKLVRADY